MKKEINEINNSKLKSEIADYVVEFLLNKKLIKRKSLAHFKLNFGYIFTKSDGLLETLLKSCVDGKNYYLAIQIIH